MERLPGRRDQVKQSAVTCREKSLERSKAATNLLPGLEMRDRMSSIVMSDSKAIWVIQLTACG